VGAMARIRSRAHRGVKIFGGMSTLVLLSLATGLADADSLTPGTLEFIGENRIVTAEGTFREWQIVESSFDLEDLPGSSAIVEVNLASVDTGIERRDAHLRNEDFFEVETFPIATVRVHSPRAAGATATGKPRFTAQFDINLHGVQKTIEGELTLDRTEGTAFGGKLIIKRTDFGVGAAPSAWNPMSIRDEIPIQFRVEL